MKKLILRKQPLEICIAEIHIFCRTHYTFFKVMQLFVSFLILFFFLFENFPTHWTVFSSHPGSVVHHPLTVIWTINRWSGIQLSRQEMALKAAIVSQWKSLKCSRCHNKIVKNKTKTKVRKKERKSFYLDNTKSLTQQPYFPSRPYQSDFTDQTENGHPFMMPTLISDIQPVQSVCVCIIAYECVFNLCVIIL